MAVKHIFLALLTQGELHGYDLKNGFEELARGKWPLNFGQVYQTLSRLERDGFIASHEVVQEEKPNKKVYQVTEAGKEHLWDWLLEDDDWNLFFDELTLRLMAFQLLDSQEVLGILRGYRSYILRVIGSLTKVMENAQEQDAMQSLLLERNLYKAEADLKWVTKTIERWGKQ